MVEGFGTRPLSSYSEEEVFNEWVSTDRDGTGIEVLLDEKKLIIYFERNGYEIYWFSLKDQNTSAKLLDFIYQIAGKTWADERVMFEMIHKIDYACKKVVGRSVQGLYCPFGRSNIVNWEKAKEGKSVV